MALPLPAATFVRLADTSPASADIQGLLDAIYTALSATVDYRGTAIPSTHQWVVGRYQNAGTTECVYLTPPVGTPMGLNPAILIAGAASGAPTMLSPDSFSASQLLMGLVRSAGAFSSWTSATPMTSGVFTGFRKAIGATTMNATSTLVRIFVSAETIFFQITNTTGSSQWWFQAGAYIEPWTPYAVAGPGVTAESDDRLYGMWGLGTVTLDSNWNGEIASQVSGASKGMPFMTGANTNGAPFCNVLQPDNTSIWTCGRYSSWGVTGGISSSVDGYGKFIAHPTIMARSSGTSLTSGTRMGMLRGIYFAGSLQSGRVYRSGATDLYHVVSASLSDDGQSILLAASP
jgi:hypothetical protein